MLLFQSNFKII